MASSDTTTDLAPTRRWFVKGLAVAATAVSAISAKGVALAQRLGYGRARYGSGPYGR